MPARAEIEARLRRQHAILSEVVTLIARREPLERWSAGLRRVLMLALAEQGLGAAETWKATALRRHLFGTPESPRLAAWLATTPAPTSDERAAAERLRADLAGYVDLRSAATLLERDEPRADAVTAATRPGASGPGCEP